MNKIYLSIIGVLCLMIFLQRQCTHVPIPAKEIVIKTDTLYKDIHLVETKKFTVYRTVTKRLPGDTVFIPDGNYEKLKQQYIELSDRYSNRNVFRDTIKVDTIGSIIVLDTVQYNTLRTRTTFKNFSIPTITKTVVPVNELTRQLYVGGEIAVSPKPLDLAMMQANMLYKDRRDRLFGIHAGINNSGTVFYGLSTYWKIKLK